MNNEEQEEEINEQDALQAVNDIAEQGMKNVELLEEINCELEDIGYHIENLDEFIVTSDNDEQKTEKDITEKKEEDTKENITKNGEQEQEEEEITLSTISEQIEANNILMENNNNLLIVNIFSNGIIAGVLLLTLLWNRYIK